MRGRNRRRGNGDGGGPSMRRRRRRRGRGRGRRNSQRTTSARAAQLAKISGRDRDAGLGLCEVARHSQTAAVRAGCLAGAAHLAHATPFAAAPTHGKRQLLLDKGKRSEEHEGMAVRIAYAWKTRLPEPEALRTPGPSMLLVTCLTRSLCFGLFRGLFL